MRGRFAPSPTGELHLGNLRTALLAWLFARSQGSFFVLRFEDLDRATVRPEFYDNQRRSLERLGLDWDDELRQSDHIARYDEAVRGLIASGRTYECFCSRREIREAAAAPHQATASGAYPGTCRDLTASRRAEQHRSGRPAAIRVRAPQDPVSFVDRLAGPYQAIVDDLVVRRNDGVHAYNLVVVLDDHLQQVAEVVRGDDLLDATTRQLHLGEIFAMAAPAHAHVPLVLGPDGARLAKRDGAVTLDDRLALGERPAAIRALLARSAGLDDASEDDTAADLAARFDPTRLHREPWVFDPGLPSIIADP